MEWLYFILIEVVIMTLSGVIGTYVISLWKKDMSFNRLLSTYGYALGFAGAAISILLWILLF
jgi:hypothetical protein